MSNWDLRPVKALINTSKFESKYSPLFQIQAKECLVPLTSLKVHFILKSPALAMGLNLHNFMFLSISKQGAPFSFYGDALENIKQHDICRSKLMWSYFENTPTTPTVKSYLLLTVIANYLRKDRVQQTTSPQKYGVPIIFSESCVMVHSKIHKVYD